MKSRPMHSLGALVLIGLLFLAACSGASAPNPPDFGNPPGEPAGGPISDEPTSAPEPGAPDQQLIIYTGSFELEVADLQAAVNQAEQLVRSAGGHVAASRAQNAFDFQFATVTYRIPAERWSEALDGLRGLATRVVDEQTESDDVSAQVVDLDARLANLRVTEVALQAIMDRAVTIDEVLKVQRELTSVRSDIESLTAQRDQLANRAALGTLEVTFRMPVDETSRASEGWDLGREIDNAVATLVRLGQGTVSLLIWTVIVLVPILVPIAIVWYVAIRIRRRWQASHPARPAYEAAPFSDQPPLGGPPPTTGGSSV